MWLRVGSAVIMVLLLRTSENQAQCCSAGNPFTFENSQMLIEPRQWVVDLSFRHSQSNTYYAGGKPISLIGPGIHTKTWYDFSKIMLMYRFSPVVSVSCEQGYYFSRGESYPDPTIGILSSNGLGDMLWHLHIRKRLGRAMYVLPSIGLTIPVGSFDMEKNHVRLPIALQPSSGDLKYHANLKIFKNISGGKTDLFLNLGYEHSNWIRSKNFTYRYGNKYFAVTGLTYQISHWLLSGFLLSYDHREKAMREDAQVVHSSGYNVLVLSPHLGVRFWGDYFLKTMLDVPVYRYYNGIQQGNRYAVTLNLSKRINNNGFNKSVNTDKASLIM